jgi:cytochrome oxidase Cu insertion factor (SCO1/SenC/PrrC family)
MAAVLGLAAPSSDRLPAFVLENYDGRPITLETLAGTTTLVVPTYAKCVAACPVVTFFLQQLDDALGAPAHVRYLLVSVQPTEDTRAEIVSHFEKHEIDPAADPRWLFANGPTGPIDRFLAEAGIDVERTPVEGGFLVDHTIRVWVVGASGSIAATFDTYFWDDEEMHRAMRDATD